MSNNTSVGYTQLIRTNANFRNLWLGETVSLFGDWFNLIASASLIATLTGSDIAIGGLFVVRALAPFLTSPFAGVLADRYNRRKMLILCDVVRIFVVLCFLLIRSPNHVWLLYVLTAVQLALGGAFFTARRAIIPDIVGKKEIGTANTITSATWSVMLAVGAAAGGLVSGALGVYTAFTIDAFTFVLSALIIGRVRYALPPEIEQAGRISIWRFHEQYLDGLRYLYRHPEIVAIALLKPALAFTSGSGYEVVQVRIAESVFPIGVGGGITLGLLYAITGVGSGLGPILARIFTQDRIAALRRAIGLGCVLTSLGLVIASTLHSFPVVLAGGLLRSLGGGITWVFSTQLLLMLVPTHVRARIFSFEQAGFSLGAAVAAAASGRILDQYPDLSAMLFGLGILTLLPALLWSAWCWIHPPIERPADT